MKNEKNFLKNLKFLVHILAGSDVIFVKIEKKTYQSAHRCHQTGRRKCIGGKIARLPNAHRDHAHPPGKNAKI